MNAIMKQILNNLEKSLLEASKERENYEWVLTAKFDPERHQQAIEKNRKSHDEYEKRREKEHNDRPQKLSGEIMRIENEISDIEEWNPIHPRLIEFKKEKIRQYKERIAKKKAEIEHCLNHPYRPTPFSEPPKNVSPERRYEHDLYYSKESYNKALKKEMEIKAMIDGFHKQGDCISVDQIQHHLLVNHCPLTDLQKEIVETVLKNG